MSRRHRHAPAASSAPVLRTDVKPVSGEGVIVVPEGDRMHRVMRVRIEDGLVVEAESKGLGSFPYAEHAFELASAEVINIVLRRHEKRAS